MKLDELYQLVGNEVVFRTSLLVAGRDSLANVRRQVSRWVKAGKIVPLRRGVYALAHVPAGRRPHPFLLANEMRRASYVSLQSALAHYGMIPEFTPTVTSVTTERPEELTAPLGRFIFRHIKHSLFWGAQKIEVAPGQFARMATREKALIDLLYLTPHSDTENYLEELRLEPTPELNRTQLRKLAQRSASKKVIRAVEKLERLWSDLGPEITL